MTKKIDRRRKYIMVIDVETANGFDNPQVYDIGFAITDKKGNIYKTGSYVIEEVYDNKQMMRGAYYFEKVPLYERMLKQGVIKKVSFRQAREEILNSLKEYNVSQISAYNLLFDMNALKNTCRTLGVSKKFLTLEQRAIELKDIWTFACNNLYTQKTFQVTALKNGWYTEKGNLQTSAEVGYRYITGEYDFIEEHTGLSDVLIECQIMAHCYKQNKKKIKGIIGSPWRMANTKELKEKREVIKLRLGIA